MGAEPDQLKQEIDETREHIAETVEALEAKADIPQRAADAVGERVEAVGETALDAAGRLDTSKLVLGGASAAALGLLVWRIGRRRG